MGDLVFARKVLLWWIVCTTVCLPLTLALFFCKRFRSKWFVWFYAIYYGEVQKKASAPARKRAFQLLNDNLPKKSPNLPFKVLEIGAGEALNLQHYPDNCDVTFLDSNDDFYSYIKENTEKYPEKVRSWRTVRQGAENMDTIASDSVDIVLSTYLHCSCSDSQAVLQEVNRVLKPGGKYVFLDHIGYPKNELGYWLQRIIYPLWYLYFDGCHTHKDVEAEIRKSSPFGDVVFHTLVLPAAFMLKYQVLGIATK